MSSSTSTGASGHSLLLAGATTRAAPLTLPVGPPAASPAGMRPARLLARLRRALAHGHFALALQPIVSLADGRVEHHEALLRITDDPRGPLPPARFLAAAERHGLIVQIDRMVLERAVRLLGEDARLAGGGIAVNLSALSVTSEGMLAHVRRTLERLRADPARLVIEVTETAAIADIGRAAAFCRGVHELGCAVALDDFGTGHGSLQHLKQLEFDYLKIDGQFVRALARSRPDQLVVQALVSVARGLGRRSVAEWVADAATLESVRALGVDCAQGHAVGRPRPALALAA